MAQGSDPSPSNNVVRRLLDTTSRIVNPASQESETYPRLRPPSLPWSGSVTGAQIRPNRLPAHVAMMRKLKSEAARFRTFFTWTNPSQRPAQLAKAGFYYFNDGDKVQCVFCLGILGQWKAGEDPAHEHRTHFPRCPFMLGDRVGNIPNRDLRLAPNRQSLSQTTLPPSPVIGNPHFQSYVSNQKESPTVFYNPAYQPPELGIEIYGQPRKPTFILLSERLETFKAWPIGLAQTPLAMAEAGFCYVNVGDRVQCYHCDIGLMNWLPVDSPWDLHARMSPHCTHVLIVKGRPYVEDHCSPRWELEVSKANTSMTSPMSGTSGDLPQAGFQSVETQEEKMQETSSPSPADGTCTICMTRMSNIVILPCSHLVACGECIVQVRGTCPVCRQLMKGYVRVFRD